MKGPLDALLLRSALARVTDSSDWRAPIDKVLPRETTERTLEMIATAIWYFTATEPTFTPTPEGIRVQADGYRVGPAGDH